MTIFIADAGGRATFGAYNNITDHATEAQEWSEDARTLCGREALAVLDIPFAEATSPCKRCLAKVRRNG
jgi:hypothetical protein